MLEADCPCLEAVLCDMVVKWDGKKFTYKPLCRCHQACRGCPTALQNAIANCEIECRLHFLGDAVRSRFVLGFGMAIDAGCDRHLFFLSSRFPIRRKSPHDGLGSDHPTVAARLSQIPGPDAARLNGGKTVASGGLFQGRMYIVPKWDEGVRAP